VPQSRDESIVIMNSTQREERRRSVDKILLSTSCQPLRSRNDKQLSGREQSTSPENCSDSEVDF